MQPKPISLCYDTILKPRKESVSSWLLLWSVMIRTITVSAFAFYLLLSILLRVLRLVRPFQRD